MDTSNLNYGDEELDCTQEQYDAYMQQRDKTEVEFTNSCTCTEVDEETGDTKLDSDGNPVYLEYCTDYCWESGMEDIEWLLQTWLGKQNIGGQVYDLHIGGTGIGWQRRSGYVIAKSTAQGVLDKLGIGGGDYTLRFTLQGEELSVIRSSHDEPMGTGKLVFRLATDEEIEFWENR